MVDSTKKRRERERIFPMWTESNWFATVCLFGKLQTKLTDLTRRRTHMSQNDFYRWSIQVLDLWPVVHRIYITLTNKYTLMKLCWSLNWSFLLLNDSFSDESQKYFISPIEKKTVKSNPWHSTGGQTKTMGKQCCQYHSTISSIFFSQYFHQLFISKDTKNWCHYQCKIVQYMPPIIMLRQWCNRKCHCRVAWWMFWQQTNIFLFDAQEQLSTGR